MTFYIPDITYLSKEAREAKGWITRKLKEGGYVAMHPDSSTSISSFGFKIQ